jgi:hypothetical protein
LKVNESQEKSEKKSFRIWGAGLLQLSKVLHLFHEGQNFKSKSSKKLLTKIPVVGSPHTP